MEIGALIRDLRLKRGFTQEQFANMMGISVQTVSRWETSVNYPDITALPLIATYFNVTTDYLLGMRGEKTMAKLIRTVETFELETKSEAEDMVKKFKSEKFPALKNHRIEEANGKFILEVIKEFNVDLNDLKFDK